jgi:hypothetical protein
MVNVVTKIQTPGERLKEHAARVQQLRKRPGVRVEPTSDDMRRLLKHPRGGGFRSEGSVEWPDDTFTRKRLRDGDIKIATEQKERGHVGSRAHHRASSE